jgi:hypothetical protein
MSAKAEATTTRSAFVEIPPGLTREEKRQLIASHAPRQPWLCTCGTPSLPGVLHRADRPCAAVRDEGAE